MAKFDDTRSYYRATAHTAPSHPRLEGEHKADVAILGAGYTGLSAALELAEAGYSVIVVEAETVGFGASGRNGGQVCSGFNKSMAQIERAVGSEAAQIAWEIADGAPRLVGERIRKYDIDCDLKWGYLHAAEKKSQLEDLKEHQAEWEKWGYKGTKLYEGANVREKIGSDRYVGALWEPDAGHVHPLNYCLGLAKAAHAAGAQIFEHSRAVKLDTGDRPAIHTEQGTVRAEHLILAGNAYLRETEPYLFRRLMPVGSYIVATEPLGDNRAKSLLPTDDAVSNCNFIVDYYRLSGDKRMLFGGRATYSGLEPNDLGGFVRPRMLHVFPELEDAKIEHVWGGYIGITVDRMPHVGRIGSRTYFSQGYSGHGLALSNMCGKILAEAIKGQTSKFDVMHKFKHPIFPGGRFRTPLLTLGMFWYRLKDALA
ncbi:MAG: FAD-binding oxidoreductase [Alphaproteobacteria bacterium]|nr:FAD-binding oxidoreductase [Alphaproteobacteria bacterium]